MRRILLLITLSAVPYMANAERTEYWVEDDEFGSGKAHKLMIGTTDTSLAALTVACYSGDGLQAQLRTDETIFPDDVDGQHMFVSVTYKGDSAPDAVTADWRMNMADYNNAWLIDGSAELFEQMHGSERLSLRLNKGGTIYRFNLVEAQEHLPTIVDACS